MLDKTYRHMLPGARSALDVFVGNLAVANG